MTHKLISAYPGLPAITDSLLLTDTNAPPLGTRARFVDPTYGEGEFIWMRGVSSLALGSWVVFSHDNAAVSLLGANDIGPVAVSMGASNTANTRAGWYQIYGKAIGKALTGYVDDALVYATATAGSVDDAVVAGDRVKNARGASAVGTPSAGLAEFEIQYPFMDDATAA